jgi:hypothetical protein
VTVNGFWIDATPVTNRQFAEFVGATGHVTFAETEPDPKNYPGSPPHLIFAGSLVFTPPKHPLDLRDWSQWWTLRKGANWRQPYGPGSDIKGLGHHPVVHVSFGDALAYAIWAGKDLVKILAAILSGMSVDEFQVEAKTWLDTARDPRWKRPYTELTYLPMTELLKYLRDNGFRTYIVTGGGQDFVRVYSEQVYAIPPDQVVGSAGAMHYSYANDGRPVLTKEPKLLLNDDNAGKPEDIHLMIGRRPYAALGNSIGDRQMLEYAKAGAGARLEMLVLHDDAQREYAYGPALGLPTTKVDTFTQDLLRRGEETGLGDYQHKERPEAYLCL